MIDILKALIPKIENNIISDQWDTLVINRRKPITYRMSRQFGEYRVCLHRFDECSPEEALPHPHPWPGAFMILRGSYMHSVGVAQDLVSQPELVYQQIVRPYAPYSITDPRIWHSVQPLEPTYSIMVNGPPFEHPHAEIRTTKGKDLQKMCEDDIRDQISEFSDLFRKYRETIWR